MRVRCISNNPDDAVKSQKYAGKGTGNSGSKYLLTIDKLYSVIAVFTMPNKSRLYLVLDDANDWVEISKSYGNISLNAYDSNLFEIVDGPDSKWLTKKGTPYTFFGKTCSYDDYVNDQHFTEKVINGDPGAIGIMSDWLKG